MSESMNSTPPAADSPSKLDRRAVLKIFASGTAGLAAATGSAVAQQNSPVPVVTEIDPASATARGSATDLNLTDPQPGGWERLLKKAEILAIEHLADIILPADASGPAASGLGIGAFFNEWLSAPYPTQLADRELIRAGFGWLNTHVWKLHGTGFRELPEPKQLAICESLCQTPADPDLAMGSKFFSRFRDLCLSGYYTTGAGFTAIGYRGNLPSPTWSGPTKDILAKLGISE